MASIRKEISTKARLEDVWAALRDVGALQPCNPALTTWADAEFLRYPGRPARGTRQCIERCSAAAHV